MTALSSLHAHPRLSRRKMLRGLAGIAYALPGPQAVSARADAPFSLPIGLPGRTPGDGFYIRHGYACENTWYNPGWLHAGEDWYALDGDTAGATVYAVARGEVVFAGADYPGRVVIVRHTPNLYSMYGHLDVALRVKPDDVVLPGQPLGTVLHRTDGRAPSHLHFEIRTFLTKREVNGAAPRYGYACGVNCPPGPGYWPINAPEHPSQIGWRNPLHALARRAFDDTPPDGTNVVVATGAPAFAPVWSEPDDHEDARQEGEIPLNAGDTYRLLSVATGSEASRDTSAEGYRLWYRIDVPSIGRVWVRAASPSSEETGSDGRPSSVRLDFLITPRQ